MAFDQPENEAALALVRLKLSDVAVRLQSLEDVARIAREVSKLSGGKSTVEQRGGAAVIDNSLSNGYSPTHLRKKSTKRRPDLLNEQAQRRRRACVEPRG